MKIDVNKQITRMFERLENEYNIIKYNTLNNTYSLQKNNTNQTIITKEFIKTNKINKEKLNQNIKDKYKEYIYNFFETLEKKLPYINFEILNKNIETLQVEQIKLIHKLKYPKIAGYFNPYTNTIATTKKINDNIYHELFHVATAIYTKKDYFGGFETITTKENIKIGVSLNEGYTSLLTERYFIDESGYEAEKNFVLLLEKIIGEKNMTTHYFNSDIISLIIDMSKYNTKEDAIEFIKNLDYLGFARDKKRIDISKSIALLNKYLITSYINKLKLENKEVDINKLGMFVHALALIKVNNRRNVHYIDLEYIKTITDNIKEEKRNSKK